VIFSKQRRNISRGSWVSTGGKKETKWCGNAGPRDHTRWPGGGVSVLGKEGILIDDAKHPLKGEKDPRLLLLRKRVRAKRIQLVGKMREHLYPALSETWRQKRGLSVLLGGPLAALAASRTFQEGSGSSDLLKGANERSSIEEAVKRRHERSQKTDGRL